MLTLTSMLRPIATSKRHSEFGWSSCEATEAAATGVENAA